MLKSDFPINKLQKVWKLEKISSAGAAVVFLRPFCRKAFNVLPLLETHWIIVFCVVELIYFVAYEETLILYKLSVAILSGAHAKNSMMDKMTSSLSMTVSKASP